MSGQKKEPTDESPCNGVCEIDGRTGLCSGCLRSLEEIIRWPGMTAEERKAVMAELGGRKA